MVWRAAQRRCTAPTRQAPAVLLAVWLSDTSPRPHCYATTSLCQLQELKLYPPVQLAVSLGRGSSHPVLQAAAVHSGRKHMWVVCSCLGWLACTDRLGRAGSSLARVDKGRCRPRQLTSGGGRCGCHMHHAFRHFCRALVHRNAIKHWQRAPGAGCKARARRWPAGSALAQPQRC